MKIAFIGGRGVVSTYSGIETYYEEVGRRLAANGHDVTVYCRSYFTPPMARYHGMRIIRVPTIRSKHLETVVHSLLSTLHVLVSRYDVVHYHALGPSLLAFVPRLFGTRTVVTVQGLDWQRAKWGRVARWVLRLGEAAAIRFPDRTIVVSNDLRRYYETHHRRTPTYVPNGVTVPGESPPTSPLEAWGLTPRQYILYVGRLSPEKRCDLLIEAYERIRPDVRLVFAGASSYTDDYVRELHRHASDDVRFLGQVTGEPLAALVSKAAVFVLPSAIEGLSIALLEAMAQGTCVLTSDIAENVEALGGAGYTFASGDAADLGRVLGRLLADAPGREAMGRRAVERVRKAYRWSHVTAETERVYREALDRMQANAP